MKTHRAHDIAVPLRALMEARGWSVTLLETMIGYSRNLIYDWRNGKRASDKSIQVLAGAFGVEPTELAPEYRPSPYSPCGMARALEIVGVDYLTGGDGRLATHEVTSRLPVLCRGKYLQFRELCD
jgi:transcriptional regulator with XRE-family HTH domain